MRSSRKNEHATTIDNFLNGSNTFCNITNFKTNALTHRDPNRIMVGHQVPYSSDCDHIKLGVTHSASSSS